MDVAFPADDDGISQFLRHSGHDGAIWARVRENFSRNAQG